MRRTVAMIAAGLVALVGANPARGAEVSRAEIEGAIEGWVTQLLAAQQADGHWPLSLKPVGQAAGLPWDVGNTGLAVLALQHSGSRNPGVGPAIKKGINYILSHPLEQKTYTAGVMEQALYLDNATRHRETIGAYAAMLCGGQRLNEPSPGGWQYYLPLLTRRGQLVPVSPIDPKWTDNSNNQFAILGLVYAEKAGYQVPRVVWARAWEYYLKAQREDGGWDYQTREYRRSMNLPETGVSSTFSMTVAGTVSTYLCEERLADKNHRQCKIPPPNLSHEAGLKWITGHWPDKQRITGAYGWYAVERLGLLVGYSEFGGHDWYQEGAADLIANGPEGSPHYAKDECMSFAVLFLARGRHPIIINKLKREGDWNLHRYDINNLIEHISGPWQIPCQWRIVTLEAKAEMLSKAPILWISGHEALKFTAEEKAKLKEYVEKGGTILAEDCCSKPSFDTSFRNLLKELWSESTLADLPQTHAIYTSFRKLESKPNLMGLALEKGQGRLGVIYIPNGISCKWEVGGSGGRSALDLGACIYLYVDKVGKTARETAAEK